MCFRVLLVVGLWDSLKNYSTRKCKKMHLNQFFARSMSAWWPGAESQRVPFMERQQVCLGSRPVIQIRFIGWSRCVYMWVPLDFESLGITVTTVFIQEKSLQNPAPLGQTDVSNVCLKQDLWKSWWTLRFMPHLDWGTFSIQGRVKNQDK